jgi:RimJ/RimL family protein N-acetyltransferase
MSQRGIGLGEKLPGPNVFLRLVTLADCTPEYVAWLSDPDVNAYLETRWQHQTAHSIEHFVRSVQSSNDTYLFAIVENKSNVHIGNIKLGPINPFHHFADISYFIGMRAEWGKGRATEAIRLAASFAFETLGLHRLQAGIYESNRRSGRALEKAGFKMEGRQRAQLRNADRWEDHVWYGALREEWILAPAHHVYEN